MKLTDLHPSLEIVPLPEQHYDSKEIQMLYKSELMTKFPFAPRDYIDLLEELDGFFVRYPYPGPNRGHLTIELKGFSEILYFYKTYEWLEEMKNCMFFGTDGDLTYFYSVDSEHTTGVYLVELSGADWPWAEFVAPSISSFLSQGVGIIEDQ